MTAAILAPYSTAAVAFTWDARTGRLLVVWRNGGVGEWSNVPRPVWTELVVAAADPAGGVGKVVQGSVKGKFAYRRV